MVLPNYKQCHKIIKSAEEIAVVRKAASHADAALDAALETTRAGAFEGDQMQFFDPRHFAEVGDQGDELVDVIGPDHDGVVIEAHELNHLNREAHEVFEQGPYWRVNRSNHLLTGEDRFVKVEVRSGAGLPPSLVVALLKAFGKDAPGPFG